MIDGARSLLKRTSAASTSASLSGRSGYEPAGWAFALIVFFGAAHLIAGIVYFFAFNWRDLPDFLKIGLPQAVMAASFLVFAASPKKSYYGSSAAILATVMIGVSMGVVGQVYQLGADPWRLFGIWAAFALPLALLARSDAHFAVFVLIGTTAFFLWANDQLRPGLSDQAVAALYAGLVFSLLVAREAKGGAPRWLRWILAASALLAATTGALSEVGGRTLFEDGAVGSLALLCLVGAILALYALWKPDRPSRALALFAAAIYVGFFGVRMIFRMDISSAGETTVAFALSALWAVGVTAGLAALLRKERS